MDDKTPPPATDYAALAQRYLELWQDQVAKLAKDPPKDMGDLAALTTAWSRMAASMTPGAAGDKHDSGAYWTPTAAAAHGDGGVDSPGRHGGPDAGPGASVAARLDAIERRLAAIESRLGALADAKPPRTGAAGGGGRGRKKS